MKVRYQEGKEKGETSNWIRRCEEKEFYTTTVRDLLVEDTASYKEMMRMTYEDFFVIPKLIEKVITPN